MAGAKESLSSPLFKKCVQFHGHQCPGLAIGYRAARLAMELLGVGRSKDEELVAVKELLLKQIGILVLVCFKLRKFILYLAYPMTLLYGQLYQLIVLI